MRGFYMINILFVILLLATGCSLALDYDSLQEGDEESSPSTQSKNTDQGTDNTPPTNSCTDDAMCEDSISCTVDTCNATGVCNNLPDNGLCEGFQECIPEQGGCVDRGKECELDGDCDDNIECTTDFCMQGVCGHTTHNELCEGYDLCVKQMVCDPKAGCVGGYKTQCEQQDEPSCFYYTCNPETGICDLPTLRPGADDDGDGHCDNKGLFGGDDCDDDAAEIFPGAPETCNKEDSNCDLIPDGTAQAGPAQITDADIIVSPAIAYSSGRYSVVWQEGLEANGAVFLQTFGTGACLVDTECANNDVDLPASEALNFTAIGGDNAAGTEPTISAQGDQIVVVWIARPLEGAPQVMAMEIPLSADGLMMDSKVVSVISDGTATKLSHPKVDWTGAADWVVAWNAEFADGTKAIQLTTRGAATPFTGIKETAELYGLDLACRSSDDCMVAYAKTVKKDAELFEARLQNANGTWSFRDGWPKMMTHAAEVEGDVSKDPSIVWTSDESWIISFTDIAYANNELDAESDVRAVVDGAVAADRIIIDFEADHINGGLVFNGIHFGLIYTHSSSQGVYLFHRVLDTSFTLLEDRKSLLSNLSDGSIEMAPMIAVANTFAIAWVEKPLQGRNTLNFAAFTTCQ